MVFEARRSATRRQAANAIPNICCSSNTLPPNGALNRCNAAESSASARLG
jgi:hypothetical protein